mgnify:CR=1 FL=1
MPNRALRFEKVTKTYRVAGAMERNQALADFSLDVPAHGITGLIGPNGSGKSTALKAALGLVRIDRGRVWVAAEKAGSESSRRNCGYVPDKGGVPRHLSGRETLVWWARMNGVNPPEAESRANTLLAQVDLTSVADRRVAAYSKGMNQRLVLAQALMSDPELLLLDEPFTGVDPHGIDRMARLLRQWVDRGKTVVLTSHLMHRVEELCDTIVLMHAGRVIASGTPAELVGGPVVKARGLDDVFRELTEPGGAS